jgi:hypothetical protein
MRGRYCAAALLLIASAGEARAQEDDGAFCASLRRLMAAAGERPAFTSLGRHGSTRVAPILGFAVCRLEPGLYGNRLICDRDLNSAHPFGPTPENRILHCLPEALRISEPAGSSLARYRVGTLAFHFERRRGSTSFSLFALPVER